MQGILLAGEVSLNTIVGLVSSVGFPIVCCGYLFYKDWKQDNDHKEEMKGFMQAIDNNSNAINQLMELIKAWKGER